MNSRNLLPFFPLSLFVRGLAVLAGGLLIASIFFLYMLSGSSHFAEDQGVVKKAKSQPPITIDLGGCASRPFFPFPAIDREISVSFNPPRPDEKVETQPTLLVRLRNAAQLKRVSLPCRIGLCYSETEKIAFAPENSPFWMELSPLATGELEAKVFIAGLSDKPTVFPIIPEETPFLSLEELPIHSPFRILAEARWWGRDLFCEKYGGANALSERIEIGPSAMAELIDLKESEWLGLREGKWEKISSLEEGKGLPVARFLYGKGKNPAMEGWDKDSYFRFTLNQPPPIPFKARPEELFSSIRVRSDKQISCMIEKQCFILKTGDWVFKGDGRWRVLRKKEEREALQIGKLIGEVFVFDKIDVRQGQKMVQGHLFNLSRSQSISVDLPTIASKSAGKSTARKSRSGSR